MFMNRIRMTYGTIAYRLRPENIHKKLYLTNTSKDDETDGRENCQSMNIGQSAFTMASHFVESNRQNKMQELYEEGELSGEGKINTKKPYPINNALGKNIPDLCPCIMVWNWSDIFDELKKAKQITSRSCSTHIARKLNIKVPNFKDEGEHLWGKVFTLLTSL